MEINVWLFRVLNVNRQDYKKSSLDYTKEFTSRKVSL